MIQRKTKIVCALGPATESAEGIASLLEDIGVGESILLPDGLSESTNVIRVEELD